MLSRVPFALAAVQVAHPLTRLQMVAFDFSFVARMILQ